MKVNIKGLVFVGFAAAILSANAMAADNTVTSKSYVDNKFQVKSTEASIGGAEGAWTPLDVSIPEQNASSSTAPTTAAVKAYVDAQSTGAASNILASSPDATDTTHALTNAATTTALNGKQTKDTGSTYQVSKAGVWEDFGDAVNTGTYTTKSVDTNGVVTIDVLGTTDTTLDSANDRGKLPTAATVKTYVDSAISNAIDSALENSIDSANYVTATYDEGTTTIGLDTTQITSSTALTTGTKLAREGDVKGYVDAKVSSSASISSTSTTTAPNESAVYGELAGKQVKSNANAGTYKVGHTGDTWATLGTAGYVQIDTTDTAAPAIQLDSAQITSSSVLTSTSTKLTREQDVYGAIQAATNGNVIPAMNTSVCNAEHPCVLTNDTSTGALVWVPIQQAETSGQGD